MVTAKDTVMDTYARCDALGDLQVKATHEDVRWDEVSLVIAEKQAELSFKAGMSEGIDRGFREGRDLGKIEGMNKVADFVNANIPQSLENYVGFWLVWQAKLKEWGLE